MLKIIIIKHFQKILAKLKGMTEKYKKRIKFNSIIMDACRDKQIISKLEKLANAVIKKYPNSL